VARKRNPYARPDARTLAAKAKGYPARSIFKLEEIDKRFRILKRGARVLDLGAAPGSWAMYAGERVGPEGSVVAVDLTAIAGALGKNVVTVQGDALVPETWLEGVGGGTFDVVLSDMAPKTTGAKVTDRMRSFELFLGALDVATRVGRPGSSFVGKIFMGEDYPEAKAAVQRQYEVYKATKPTGTRSNSSELYVIGLRMRS
jgi:23S rRNA (uridine2552-2'-O)-methyltransferase